MTTTNKPLTKTALAKKLGVSRSSLYYHHKRPAQDEEVRRQIEAVMVSHPSYGHKRIALELKLNKKRILRVMKKFNLKPYRRRHTPAKPGDLGKAPTKHHNLICTFCVIRVDVVWVTDFTYIRFHEYFIYVATFMDLYSREIVGWYVSRYHTSALVLGAWQHALTNLGHHAPLYSHSDQGSEYDSTDYEATISQAGTQISMSHKGSPWENGYQESFYSQFKLDLGDPNRFEELGELVEAINHTIVEYNEKRIHTSLKTTPANFRRLQDKRLTTQMKDMPSNEMGT